MIRNAYWVDNVVFCTDEDSAIDELQKQTSNVSFTNIFQFEITNETELHNVNDGLVYCEFLLNSSADIICNFQLNCINSNFIEISIDDKICTNPDFIFLVACSKSIIKIRFYLPQNKESINIGKKCQIQAECIYLTEINKAQLLDNNGLIDTIQFHYEDGYCIPRNIKILYLK